ncbi:MAG: hypothetical protein RL584_1988, partial [Pseudomonadota bacterium]
RRNGPLSLQEIVLAALLTVRGRFFHIGPLDAAWVSEIRDHRIRSGNPSSQSSS